jgi:hypothetical protein
MTTTLDVDTHWSHHGLCRGQAQLFDANTTSDMFEAIDICYRCPVLNLCDQWRQQSTDPYRTGVIAGVYYGK